MAKPIMPACTLALIISSPFSLPVFAEKRPTEFICDGQIADSKDLATISLVVDFDQREWIISGKPLVQPVCTRFSEESHQYVTQMAGFLLILSRVNMRFELAVEGLQVSGQCQHLHTLI